MWQLIIYNHIIKNSLIYRLNNKDDESIRSISPNMWQLIEMESDDILYVDKIY